MAIWSDLRVLYHMALKPVRGKSHADRLESFYAGQAESYDDFRRRLLKGREELWRELELPEDGVWVDMGGGTGSNLEYVGEKLSRLRKVYIVDLSPSLLRVARQRIESRGWNNVEAVEADATRFRPPEGHCDLVTFSYSLTMIPDWFAALEHVHDILQPGGQIGAVDFFVARKHVSVGMTKQGWLTRTGWPIWFASDNVFLSPDHVPYLHSHFEPIAFHEHRGKVPYVPFFRVPYYTFVGRK